MRIFRTNHVFKSRIGIVYENFVVLDLYCMTSEGTTNVKAEVLQCEEPKSSTLKYMQKYIVEESLLLRSTRVNPSRT